MAAGKGAPMDLHYHYDIGDDPNRVKHYFISFYHMSLSVDNSCFFPCPSFFVRESMDYCSLSFFHRVR